MISANYSPDVTGTINDERCCSGRAASAMSSIIWAPPLLIVCAANALMASTVTDISIASAGSQAVVEGCSVIALMYVHTHQCKIARELAELPQSSIG